MAFSFKERNKQIELRNCLRRIVDITSPNLPPLEGDARSDNRYNRTIPVLLAPWEDDGPVVDESATALTKDFSELGIALVLHQPFRAEQVVIAFRLSSEPRLEVGSTLYFVLGSVRQNAPIGGGFWQLGIMLTDLLNRADLPQLEPLVSITSDLVPSPANELPGPVKSLQ